MSATSPTLMHGRRLPSVPRLRWRPHTGHEQAALDFVRHLLEGQLVAPAEALDGPVGSFYRDTYERIGQMAVRGVLAFLVRSGGWAMARHIDASGERVATGRLWHAPQMARLEPRLGANALLTCTELFEAFGRRRLDQQRALPPSLLRAVEALGQSATPWEDLLLHLLARPLAMLNQGPQAVSVLTRASRFCALTLGAQSTLQPAPSPARIAEALDAWGWTLPWISEEVAWWWTQADAARFAGGLERFDDCVGRLTLVLESVIEHALAKGRHDWLLPIADFFTASYGAVEDVVAFSAPLEALSEGTPLRERQTHRDVWGRLLRAMSTLGRERTRIQRAHPVDREAAERIFLAYWEETGAEVTLTRVERLRAHLERVIT